MAVVWHVHEVALQCCYLGRLHDSCIHFRSHFGSRGLKHLKPIAFLCCCVFFSMDLSLLETFIVSLLVNPVVILALYHFWLCFVTVLVFMCFALAFFVYEVILSGLLRMVRYFQYALSLARQSLYVSSLIFRRAPQFAEDVALCSPCYPMTATRVYCECPFHQRVHPCHYPSLDGVIYCALCGPEHCACSCWSCDVHTSDDSDSTDYDGEVDEVLHALTPVGVYG